jgi:hypothetical protein
LKRGKAGEWHRPFATDMLDAVTSIITAFLFCRSCGVSSRKYWGLMDGIRFACWHCGIAVVICRGCWRGQKYCSLECRHQSQLQLQRTRQARYAITEKGKKSQQLRSRRYRLKNFATDASTQEKSILVKEIHSYRDGRCRICGRRVVQAIDIRFIGHQFSLRRLAHDSPRNTS